MARAFLLKLVKATHARGGSDRSDRSNRSEPSDSGQSSISKTTREDPTTPTSSNTSADTPPKITISDKGTESRSSLRTEFSSSSSQQPVVTVVPPSPHSSLLQLGEPSDRRTMSGDVNTRDAKDLDRTTPIITSSAPHHHSVSSRPPRTSPPSPPPTGPAPPPLSPVPEENTRTNTSSPMAKTLDPSPQTRVRRSPSAKSLTMAESDAVMQRPLVESPTAIRADLPSVDSTNGTSSLHPSRDSDAASLASTNQNGTTKDKKRPWRKSTARKPTGLAGAIAASGMAMAQPTLSAIHQASFSATMQAQAQPNAPSTSTTRKSSINSPPRSPRGSVINHARGKSSEFSPHSTRSKRSGAGRASVSVQSDNASEYYPDDRPDYYSGLDESSDEDEGLEGESMLDEMEDMPVTGFAVASNKRNADFHDLFPTVPEGDYLIEGTAIFCLNNGQ